MFFFFKQSFRGLEKWERSLLYFSPYLSFLEVFIPSCRCVLINSIIFLQPDELSTFLIKKVYCQQILIFYLKMFYLIFIFELYPDNFFLNFFFFQLFRWYLYIVLHFISFLWMRNQWGSLSFFPPCCFVKTFVLFIYSL